MDGDIVDQVTSWESKPFSGGHSGLRDLATDGFSGAVQAADTWVFFLNGNVVGVFDGDIEALADADGTVYQAPGLALPLLFTMQEHGGEQKARYYTEDTPLTEVDGTLSEANFTGYVELSENVLSGDYYVVYHGGRSLSAAFVGNQREVITGDEAFDRAADEVGIYEVRTVPIDVVDIPEPTEPEGAVGGVVEEAEPPADDDPEEETDPEPADDPGDSTAPEPPTADPEPESTSTATESTASPDPAAPPADDVTTEADPTQEERFDDEAEWRQTRTIPSLSPSEEDPDADQTPTPTAAESTPEPAASEPSASTERTLDRAESQLAELEQRVESLAAERDQAQSQRQELENELASVREERDRLAERIETLEAERTADDSASTERAAGTSSMDPATALAQTNLFVRYGSKSDATLEAVAGGASQADVNANLQLDHHTQFDADAVTVEGQDFTTFLTQTPEYAFVEWVITELPYEIRETDHGSDLRELYGAIPKIDRAQLAGTVTARTEDGEVTADYDVVLRGRKGEPLIVATINDSRDPVTGSMMSELVERTSAIAAGAPELGAAMSVTASFFKPDALEAAEEATSGGFLSRDSQASFVRTGRKQGYHLCLTESRKGAFHVTVPEL